MTKVYMPDIDLYVIRHAESDWNANGSHIIGGRSNETPLTPVGEVQAEILGIYLKEQIIIPDQVFASPAIRTIETARIALSAMGIQTDIIVDDELQEMDQGEWVGQVRDDVYTDAVKQEMELLGKDFKAPGGESMNETGLRMYKWANKITTNRLSGDLPEKILAFGHGVATRSLGGYLNSWSREEIFAAKTENTSISLFSRRSGRWLVDYVGKMPAI